MQAGAQSACIENAGALYCRVIARMQSNLMVECIQGAIER